MRTDTVYENFIHTFYKISYQTKSSMIPSADSSFGHSLSGTSPSKKGSSRTRRFENDLQVTRLWPHHERVPRPSHKPGRNNKAHVRVSTKECPFCPFCFSIFVLFLNIYCQLVTTIFIDPGDYNFQAPPHLYSGEIWKRRLWGFGERNTRSLSWTMASRDFPFPRFHPALI